MSVKTQSLEKIKKRLIMEGKKLDGQITYTLITEIFSQNQENISMEALDYIHHSLSREGIELVDQLSSHAQNKIKRKAKTSYHSHRVKTARCNKYRRAKQYLPILNWTDQILCPEDALDQLLLKAETQILCEKDLQTVINECRLFFVEVEQLLDYLTLKAIDTPNINLSPSD